MLLVFIGCGSVSVLLMLAAETPTVSAFDIGIGTLGGLGDWLAVGVAFGLAVAVVIYALGGVSGAHINPAVSIALWSIKKFPAKDTVADLVQLLRSQVLVSGRHWLPRLSVRLF